MKLHILLKGGSFGGGGATGENCTSAHPRGRLKVAHSLSGSYTLTPRQLHKTWTKLHTRKIHQNIPMQDLALKSMSPGFQR